MTTMRAARFHGNKDIRVEDVPIPELRPGEVLIEIEWCGICGSDLHEYTIGEWIESYALEVESVERRDQED